TLIIPELLSEKEKNWLNEYHNKVNILLKPLLSNELHGFLDELTCEI
ncbi:MAG TPA: M24 family metallopeptidase C-terminal domain-containing protein, partial [Draconibacterium sp.]|nr:M24 family metallopeptidase C-terminal domain-containing protein [Draconibacterium sp.]